MEKPRILISGSNESRETYETAVTAAGGLPCSFYCPPCDVGYDGLLLCGGDDVDPARFGEENAGSQGIDSARDAAELALAAAYFSAGKPILGICRGHQVLNIALGGSLVQDIAPSLHPFHTRAPADTDDKIHPIRTAAGSLLFRLYGPACAVNSSHHQALGRLGDGLTATAWSESGLIEAMELPGRPVLGVQFHPERMAFGRQRGDAADGGPIFHWFLGLCQGGPYAQ